MATAIFVGLILVAESLGKISLLKMLGIILFLFGCIVYDFITLIKK